eukprot:4956048-Lingulodinium_polyedra.AAC.1
MQLVQLQRKRKPAHAQTCERACTRPALLPCTLLCMSGDVADCAFCQETYNATNAVADVHSVAA